uniref:Uncharacterized protein n=1 Tax=Cyprinus carpio TaxID=7962 RepID=A0A8C2HM87_CYPCA
MGQLCCFPLSRHEDKLSKCVDGAPLHSEIERTGGFVSAEAEILSV